MVLSDHCFLPFVACALCSSMLPPSHHHATYFRSSPPIHVPPWGIQKHPVPCSSPAPNPFCWWYHQPQPSLPQSSFFLIFLWVCLLGFCPTLTCPYHASPLSLQMVLSLLWCELFCGPHTTGTGVSTALWGGRWGRASLAVEGEGQLKGGGELGLWWAGIRSE